MEELIQEVQKLLETKNIEANYYDYVHMYERIHNKGYTGCRCKKQTLYNIINNWYINNKT